MSLFGVPQIFDTNLTRLWPATVNICRFTVFGVVFLLIEFVSRPFLLILSNNICSSVQLFVMQTFLAKSNGFLCKIYFSFISFVSAIVYLTLFFVCVLLL